MVAYEEEIVSYVCKSIVADRKWDDSHVQGKSSTHKVIDEKIGGIGVSRKYKVKVVGMYGVGVGKTTTTRQCAMLCLASMKGGFAILNFPVFLCMIPKSCFNKY